MLKQDKSLTVIPRTAGNLVSSTVHGVARLQIIRLEVIPELQEILRPLLLS